MNGEEGFGEFAPLQSSPPPKEKKGCVTGKRILGCGCGCLAVIAVLLVAIVLMYHWVTASLPLTPGTIYIDADTVSVLWARVDLSDEGLSDLFKTVFSEIDPRNLPDDLREALEKAGKDSAADMLSFFLPAEIVCVSPVSVMSAERNALWAVSYHRAYKPINWLFGESVEKLRRESPDDVVTCEEVEIARFMKDGDERYAASIDNNLITSAKLELVEKGVERFRLKTSDFGGNALLKEMYDKLAAQRDAFGIVINKDGLLLKEYKIFDELAKNHPEVDFERIRAVSWYVDVVSSDMIEGEMFLKTDSADMAKEISDAFSRDASEIEKEVSEKGMQVNVKVASEAEFIHVEFGLKDFKDELVERLKGE